MKKSHIKIIDETVIELKESFNVTIERLMAQQGVCRNTDSQDMGLEFYCNKKGNISIFNNTSGNSEFFHRIYKVQGEVVEEDGKTKVIIRTYKDNSTISFRYVSASFYVLTMILYTLFLFFIKKQFSLKDLIPFPVFLFLIVDIFIHTKKETLNNTTDIEIMKKEIINRVEAVKRWDD